MSCQRACCVLGVGKAAASATPPSAPRHLRPHAAVAATAIPCRSWRRFTGRSPSFWHHATATHRWPTWDSVPQNCIIGLSLPGRKAIFSCYRRLLLVQIEWFGGIFSCAGRLCFPEASSGVERSGIDSHRQTARKHQVMPWIRRTKQSVSQYPCGVSDMPCPFCAVRTL